MVIRAFPDVSLTDESGLLAAGGDLDVESLLLAYRNGIFPWPVAGDYPLLWFCPPKRAVLFFDRFHVPRRLKKKLRSGRYDFRINASFASVISRCAEANNRKGEKGTWITPEMISAYVALHEAGYCHCIECLLEAKTLGGLYGVAIGKMFAGESMYYLETDGSKLCLCFLVDYLQQRGVNWLDCQQMTPLLASFGAEEVERELFLAMVHEAVSEELKLF